MLGATGRPLAGAQVTVCSNVAELGIPCLSTINLFDSTGAGISNPQTTDGRGNLNFWAPPGKYLMTVSGTGITPYRLVISLPCVIGGTNCGGGGGSVGPGTPNTVAKFSTTTNVGNSSVTDDNVNPTRAPNGVNSANLGFYAEWVVDAGPGVTANKLVCRSASDAAKVVICPIGTTQNVLGVAQATVAAGNTVQVCFAGKCNVISSNNFTNRNWLIPSASVAGDVDDTGSPTKPTTAIQTLPAETTGTAGQAVLTTFLSPDTLNGIGSGTGTILACAQYGVPYFSAPGTGTTLNCIPSPTSNGSYYLNWLVTGNAAVQPVASRAGAPPRIVSATTDTILCADRAPGLVYYTSATGAAITVPDVGSTCFGSSPVFGVMAANTSGGVQTFTFNRQTASTFTVINGTDPVTTGTSFFLNTGQFATLSTHDGANWTVRITAVPTPIGSITGTWQNIGGNYTVTDADNTLRDRFTSPNAAITLPQPSTIAVPPFVAQKFVSNSPSASFTSAPFTQTAGHQMFVQITQGGSNAAVLNVTDSHGGVFSLLTTAQDTLAKVDIYYLTNIVGGSTTISVSFASAPNASSQIDAWELQGTTHDNSTSAALNGITSLSLTNPIRRPVAVSLAGGRTALPTPSFTTLEGGNCNLGCLSYRYFVNQSSITAVQPGNNEAFFQTILSMSSIPAFTAGWYFIAENPSTGPITVTSTASFINGQTNLVMAPNEWCSFESNGTNWDAICGFIPNITTNGVMGGLVEAGSKINNNIGADIGATTVATPGADSAFLAVASVTCRSSVAGTETVTISYTDTNNIAQTIVATTGTCNGGSPTIGSVSQPFRAKASTNIQVTTTHTGTQPTYDVDVSILQRHTL